VRRREFIGLLGAVAAWPLATRAHGERMRRIGVLMSQATDDPIANARNAAFLQGLQELGWTVAQNVQLEYRWGPRSRCISRPDMKKGLDGAWNTVEAGKCCPYWYAPKPSHSMQARSRSGRIAKLRTLHAINASVSPSTSMRTLPPVVAPLCRHSALKEYRLVPE
jgi:hypothetical protein